MKKAKEQAFRPYLDEREQQMWEDYEWCLHDPEVRRKYGGKVVVAPNKLEDGMVVAYLTDPHGSLFALFSPRPES